MLCPCSPCLLSALWDGETKRDVFLGSESGSAARAFLESEAMPGRLRKAKMGGRGESQAEVIEWSLGVRLCLHLQQPRGSCAVFRESLGPACFSLCLVSAFGKPGRVQLPPPLSMASLSQSPEVFQPQRDRPLDLVVTTVCLFSSRIRSTPVTSTRTSTRSSALCGQRLTATSAG